MLELGIKPVHYMSNKRWRSDNDAISFSPPTNIQVVNANTQHTRSVITTDKLHKGNVIINHDFQLQEVGASIYGLKKI